MITIDDMIILNQMCQRHSNKDAEQEWFLAQSSIRQHNLIEWLAQMINQAGANNLDLLKLDRLQTEVMRIVTGVGSGRYGRTKKGDGTDSSALKISKRPGYRPY